MPSTIEQLSNLNNIKNGTSPTNNSATSTQNDFSKVLKNSISELNDIQEKSDKAMADIATGEVKNLHQAALAIGKAETSMKVMLEIRNKALSAYKEISKTQI
jgi:flagellar hook-basal body complex protein FliE